MKPYQVVFRPSVEVVLAFKPSSFMSKLREDLRKKFKQRIGWTDFWIAYSFSKHIINGDNKYISQVVGCVWLKPGDEAGARSVVESVTAQDGSGASQMSFKPLEDVVTLARHVAKNAYAARNHLTGRAYGCTSQLEKSAALVYQLAPIAGPLHTLEIQGRLMAVRALERELRRRRH